MAVVNQNQLGVWHQRPGQKVLALLISEKSTYSLISKDTVNHLPELISVSIIPASEPGLHPSSAINSRDRKHLNFSEPQFHLQNEDDYSTYTSQSCLRSN